MSEPKKRPSRRRHRCVVIGCKFEENDGKLSYHEYPSNVELRAKWKQIIKIQGNKIGTLWEPPDYAKICSKHFLPSDFRTETKVRFLLPSAVPTVFTSYPKHLRPKVDSGRRVVFKHLVPPKKRKLQDGETNYDVTSWSASDFCQVNIDVDSSTTSLLTSSKAGNCSSNSGCVKVNKFTTKKKLPYNTALLEVVETPEELNYIEEDRKQNLLPVPKEISNSTLKDTVQKLTPALKNNLSFKNNKTKSSVNCINIPECKIIEIKSISFDEYENSFKTIPKKSLSISSTTTGNSVPDSENHSTLKQNLTLFPDNDSTHRITAGKSKSSCKRISKTKTIPSKSPTIPDNHSLLKDTEHDSTSCPENNFKSATAAKKSLIKTPQNHSTVKKTIPSSSKEQNVVVVPENNALRNTKENLESTAEESNCEETFSYDKKCESKAIQADSYSMELRKLTMKINMLQKQNRFLRKQNNKQCKQITYERLKTESLRLQVQKNSKDVSVLEKIKTSAKEKSPMGSYVYDLIRSFNLKRPRWSETTVEKCVAWRQDSPWSYKKARSMEIIKTPSHSTLDSYVSDKKLNSDASKVKIKTKKQSISQEKEKTIIVIDEGIHITVTTKDLIKQES